MAITMDVQTDVASFYILVSPGLVGDHSTNDEASAISVS